MSPEEAKAHQHYVQQAVADLNRIVQAAYVIGVEVELENVPTAMAGYRYSVPHIRAVVRVNPSDLTA